MDMDNQDDDPQFVKVLETCLKMVIAETKQQLDAKIKEIETQKTMIRTELDKRKQFKTKVTQMDKISVILNETLTILNVSIGETSETLEMVKANIDDQYKLNQMRIQEYQNIIAEYEETWNTYRTMYEEFPLAKTRNAVKNNLQKLKIEYMIMDYKKTEMMTIIKQRLHIDWIRTRCKIIEFTAVMVERLELEKKLMKLKILIWVISTYFSDNISVNTLILEELCINENTGESPEIIDVEAICEDNDFRRTAGKQSFQAEKSSNLKNTVVTEKMESNAALVVPDAEIRIEKEVNDVEMDNNINMKEIHQEEIQRQKSQESVKTQTSRCTNKNPSKHNASRNIQDEIQAKRIKFQRENSKDSNVVIAPQSSRNVKEVDLKSSSSVPKIVSVEPVHYNIVPPSKSVRQPSILSNMITLQRDYFINVKPEYRLARGISTQIRTETFSHFVFATKSPLLLARIKGRSHYQK
ncbi:hypothetical protein EAG_08914 [Camponotus floridanus]|uniref:Uncharacterized protein n=1 Tax=Camponotus floridanus TaxID=104421 RepID=E1ZWM3_CAMFO|nr:hypothetical protein EAG_08914 [Camponotus floridanus]